MKVNLKGTSYENSFFTGATGHNVSVADLKSAMKTTVSLKHSGISSVDTLTKLRMPGTFTGTSLVDGTVKTDLDASLPIYVGDDYLYVTQDGINYKLGTEENKYFKNVLKIYGLFDTENSVSNGKAVTNYNISKIDSYSFMSTAVDTADRILDIEEIRLRSNYASSIENQYASALVTTTATLMGYKMDVDSNQKASNVRAVFSFNYAEDSTGLTTASNIMPLWPYYEEDGSSVQEAADENGDLDLSDREPAVCDVNLASIVSSDDDSSLVYYKNNLVIKADIDLSSPTVLDFNKYALSKQALAVLSVNDTIVDTYCLNSSESIYSQYDIESTDGATHGNILDTIYDNSTGIFLVVFQSTIMYAVVNNWTSNWASNFTAIDISSTLKISKIYSCIGSYFDGTTAYLYIKTGKSSDTLLITIDFSSTETPDINYDSIESSTVNTEASYSAVMLNGESGYCSLRDLSFTKDSRISSYSNSVTTNVANAIKNKKEIGLPSGVTLSKDGMIHGAKGTVPWVCYSLKLGGEFTIKASTEAYQIAKYSQSAKKWEFTQSTGQFTFLENYNVGESTADIDIYLVTYSFANIYDNDVYGDDIIAAALPKPNVYEGKHVFIIASNSDCETKGTLNGFTISNGKNASCSLTSAYVSRPAYALTDAFTEDLETCPVEDDEVENEYARMNTNGQKCFISNNRLCLYTNLRMYDKNDDGTFGVSTDKTSKKYWVAGYLPSVRSLNFVFLESKENSDAYTEVKEVYDSLLKKLSEEDDEPYSTLNTWLTANPPLDYDTFASKYQSGTHNFVLSGVSFVERTDGTIPAFSSKNSVTYEAPIETSVILSSDTATAADNFNYISYLTDYYTIIMGVNKFEDWTTEDVYLTDSRIILRNSNGLFVTAPLSKLTSRDEIEDFENWNATMVNEDFFIAGWDETSTKYKEFMIDGTLYELEDYFAYSSLSVLNIEDVYVEDDSIAIAGYVSTEDISDTTLRNALISNGVCQKNGLYTAVVYYSTDGAETWSEFTLTNVGSCGSSCAGSFTRNGDKLYVTYGATDRSAAYLSQFTIASGVISKSSAADTTLGSDSISNIYTTGRHNFKFTTGISSVYGTIRQSGTALCNTTNGDILNLCLPTTISYNGAKVISKGSASVTLNKGPDGSEGTVTLLISIRTLNDINIQTKYLDYNSDYFTSTGEMIVTEYEEVDSYETADRMYNSNNEAENSSTQCSGGVPTYLYDYNHDKAFYEYYASGSVRSRKNSSDNKIYVVDSYGRFFTTLETEYDASTVYSLKTIMENSLNIWSVLPCAPMLNEDAEGFTSSNAKMTTLFSNLSNKKLTLLNATGTSSRIEMSSDSDMIDNVDLMIWPTTDTAASYSTISTKYASSNLGKYLAAYVENIGAFNASTRIFSDMFEGVGVKINGKTKILVHDKVHDLYLANSFYQATLTSNVPYLTSSAKTIISGYAADINDGVINDINSVGITGVYLPTTGYGGDIYNEDWDKNLPWDNDTEAFSKSKLLTNTYGQYVYMTDLDGLKIHSKSGMDLLSAGKQIEVSYDLLAKQKNVVELFTDWADTHETYNIYKLETGTLEIYTPDNYWQSTTNAIRVLCDGVDVTSEATITTNKGTFTYNGDGSFTMDSYFTDANLYITATYHGLTATKTLKPKTKLVSVTSVEPMEFNNGTQVTKTASATITFGEALLDYTASSDDVIIKSQTSTSVKVEFGSYVSSASVTLTKGDDTQTINLDVRLLDLSLICSHDWYYGSVLPEAKVISGTTLYDTATVSSAGLVDYTSLSGQVILNKQLTALESVPLYSCTTKNWIFCYGDDTDAFVNSFGSAIFVKGLYSYVIMVAPNYNSFSDLTDELGQIIDGDIIATRDSEDIATITEVSDGTISIDTDFSDKFDADRDTHILMYRLCTASTISIDKSVMNDLSYVYEVPSEDVDVYGYDRVYINENAFPMSPLVVDNQVFYTDNASCYKSTLWDNENGNAVYLADENGYYAKAVKVDDDTLSIERLGDSANLSEYVTDTSDARVQPYELLWDTNVNRFEDEFVSGANPFNLYARVREVFSKGEWTIKTGAYKEAKKNGSKAYVTTDEMNIYNGEIYKGTAEGYEDNDGYITFIAVAGEDCSLTKSEVIKYGIKATRSSTYSQNSIYESPADCALNFSSSYNYLINVMPDDVVDITEFGIFDDANELIVYGTHPKVEYSTKDNHISYTVLIKEN